MHTSGMIPDASPWIIKFPKVPFAHRVTESRHDKSYKSLQWGRERQREMYNLCVVVGVARGEMMFVLTTGDIAVRKHSHGYIRVKCLSRRIGLGHGAASDWLF